MASIISEYSQIYLSYLKELVNRRSVFENPEDAKKTIEYAKKIFEENLAEYEIYFDEKQNCIARPKEIDLAQDILYLNAHIDTVGAEEAEWDAPFHPFQAYENEHEIVGRGVSDCKAGVACELFLSFLVKEKLIHLKNTVFTITFKEEGPGEKTATCLAKNMGSGLPVSEKMTYLLVLENNVRVENPPVLCAYAAERGNFVIRITGTIFELQKHLRKLTKWNPIAIFPEKEHEKENAEIIEQKGGHVCSVERAENKLTKVLLDAEETSILHAGKKENMAIVPSKIFVQKGNAPEKHVLMIGKRNFDTLEETLHELQGIRYEEVKNLSRSEGFDGTGKFRDDRISKVFHECEKTSEIKIEYTHNIGGSDASTILNSLPKNLLPNFLPIVMGPGSRSQRNAIPPRLTHGKNETFDKESGGKAICFITEVLEKSGFLVM
ncbi:M20/M25/M40 family metallo-hydrolase [Candidatus Peregrinibacteria bacterium]|nr:M20/M25/M40 family metallo-hydrolase [Candidatus Peregrinibacteria bacterium]